MHSYRHSRREIKAAFGADVEDLFASFDRTALASGSIAQVHRATLRPEQYRRYLSECLHAQVDLQHHHLSNLEEEQQVVVKVCHPRVAEHIRQDFKLMAVLSAAFSKLPLLRGLPLRESVAQFSQTMTAQADLRVEAVHALRFHNNFAGEQAESWHEGGSLRLTGRPVGLVPWALLTVGTSAECKALLFSFPAYGDLLPANIFMTIMGHATCWFLHQPLAGA